MPYISIKRKKKKLFSLSVDCQRADDRVSARPDDPLGYCLVLHNGGPLFVRGACHAPQPRDRSPAVAVLTQFAATIIGKQDACEERSAGLVSGQQSRPNRTVYAREGYLHKFKPRKNTGRSVRIQREGRREDEGDC